MPEPLVSVVLPIWNGERYLAEAIESVLGQSHPSVELVIVDDGSTDGGPELAASYPEVKLIRQENRGVAAARNRGVSESTGDLLAFIDQDDVYAPEKLELQVAELERRPDAGVCVCVMEFVLEPGCELPEWVNPKLLGLEVPSWQLGCLLIRREAFDRVGPFDTSYRWCSDADWFVRMRDGGVRDTVIDDVLMRYRIHESNDSGTTNGMWSEQLRVFRSSVHRKRRAARDG
jgi:glycosyltransferase involved in cell wall biosynthesis